MRHYNPGMFAANPRRKRRRARRNPVAALGTMQEWTQGLGWQDAAAATAGLAAASILPSTLIKPGADGQLSTIQKLLRVVIGIGAAVGVGSVGKSMFTARAGQAAVAGGLAGTAIQALSSFTNLKLAGPTAIRALRPGIRIGEAEMVSPSATREGETIQMIMP